MSQSPPPIEPDVIDELADPAAVAALDSAPVPRRSEALGERAAMGFFYSLVSFFASKVLTLGGQLTLSWILGNADFGYIGLTLMVGFFGSLLAQWGVREVLIQRWRDVDRWAAPAFWLSVTLGAIATVATAAAAPVAAWFFHDPRLTPLIFVLSFQNICNSFAIVPEARLTIDLRFKRLNVIYLVSTAVFVALSITLALLGFGPYSFILPWPAMAAFRAVLFWLAVRPPVGRRPQLRMWREMAGDNVRVLVCSFFMVVVIQCDYVILGRMYPDKKVVGLYFWAFSLSSQAIQVLSQNVGGVLLPSLAKLQDEPARQLSAFLRASKALTVLMVPACLLQAMLADPAIRLFLPVKWYPAIPIVAVLSGGWLFLSAYSPAVNMLKAQGRFSALMRYLGFCAGLFLVVVYIGARRGAGLGAATGVAVYSAVAGPLGVYLAIRPLGGKLRDMGGVFLSPVLVGAGAFGIAGLLAWVMPHGPLQHVLRMLVICGVGAVIYIPIIRRVARPAVEEIMTHAQGMLRRVGLQRAEPS
jgi:O-antigen/teichoic acid export membrane protein